MKILFIIAGITTGHGVLNSYQEALIEGIAARGHQVVCLCTAGVKLQLGVSWVCVILDTAHPNCCAPPSRKRLTDRWPSTRTLPIARQSLKTFPEHLDEMENLFREASQNRPQVGKAICI